MCLKYAYARVKIEHKITINRETECKMSTEFGIILESAAAVCLVVQMPYGFQFPMLYMVVNSKQPPYCYMYKMYYVYIREAGDGRVNI